MTDSEAAARGGRQSFIEKRHDGFVARTSVQWLDGGKRREEITHMLSGAQVTDEARAPTTRLLEAD